jgi:hypothetical protein
VTAHAGPVPRVGALIAAARRLADPRDPLGIRARNELPEATGLSPEGVELALTRCLETHPSDDEVLALVRSVRPARRAHVLLSANVFVAAHRAIALALAASDVVFVRASRREPLTVRLLESAAPALFTVVEQLDLRPGDHLWAYGEAETLDALRREIPEGVVLLAHGPGFGVVFVDAPSAVTPPDLAATAGAVADDVVPFDQHGCLSPRIVFVLGDPSRVRAFAGALSDALAERAVRVPVGRLDAEDLAGRTRYRDTLLAAGTVLPSGDGFVGLDLDGRAVVVPPPGRNVHVMHCTDPAVVSGLLGTRVTSVAVAGDRAFADRIQALFPHARVAVPGGMQTPPFDGPVDRRPT